VVSLGHRVWLWAAVGSTLAIAAFLVLPPAYVHLVVSQQPGGFAKLYLSEHSPYQRIVLEVDYQPDRAPTGYALDVLKARIEEYTGKPVDLVASADLMPLDRGWPRGQSLEGLGGWLRDLHLNRQTGFWGGNITIYIAFLNETVPPDIEVPEGEVVGAAVSADTIVVFAGNLTSRYLEATTLVHELGHLWGLPHEDDSHCVMASTIHVYSQLDEMLLPIDFCTESQARLEQLHQAWMFYFF